MFWSPCLFCSNHQQLENRGKRRTEAGAERQEDHVSGMRVRRLEAEQSFQGKGTGFCCFCLNICSYMEWKFLNASTYLCKIYDF